MTDPAEQPFVLDVSDEGVHHRALEYGDLYTSGESGRPTIVFVPGPAQDDPRRWPVYVGYGRLAVQHGVDAVVAKLDYTAMERAGEAADRLAQVIDAIGCDRLALWAFSGGGLLMPRWLAQPPPALRVVGLTYPVFGTPPEVKAGLPIVLTRAELEMPRRLAVVDEFIAANEVEVVHAVGGQHGFDLLDRTENSRVAVRASMDTVCAHLTRG